MIGSLIKIYTDGSCHTQQKTGAWAAILLIDQQEVVLQDVVLETTHNRMELLAPIKAIEYLKTQKIAFESLSIFSDSQYVVNLLLRKERLQQSAFCTKKGTPIRNADLVKTLIKYLDCENIHLVKVKAHQKKTEQINYNRKVDQLARKSLRSFINRK